MGTEKIKGLSVSKRKITDLVGVSVRRTVEVVVNCSNHNNTTSEYKRASGNFVLISKEFPSRRISPIDNCSYFGASSVANRIPCHAP